MKILTEQSLTNFKFWSGAKYNADRLTYEELEELENILESDYTIIDEGVLNDLMWFEFELVAELLGLQYDSETDTIIRED